MKRLLPLLLVLLALAACHPSGPQPATDKNSARRAMGMYTIQWGDSLDWIAYRFGVPGGYQELAKINHLRDPDLIYMGDRLRIPRTGSATASLPPWPDIQPVQKPLRACPSEHARPPAAAQLSGCSAAACVDLDGWRRVCSCAAEQGSSGFLLIEGGRPIQAWPAPVLASSEVDPYEQHGVVSDFDVLRVDLDGDGRREQVVAFRRLVNDLGMSWWNLAVLSGARPQDPPMLLTAANYGEGSVIRDSDDGGCDLLSTTWEMAWEPGRAQEGWYLVGRPMRYRQGALTPLANRPLYARRLLYSFEPGVAQLPGGLLLGTPEKDLSQRATGLRQVEPAAARLELAREPATVTTASLEKHAALGLVPSLTLERDGMGAMTLQWEAYSLGYQGLGDASSGRLFPPGYKPASPSWPHGQQAWLSSYQSYYGDPKRLVWLQ